MHITNHNEVNKLIDFFELHATRHILLSGLAGRQGLTWRATFRVQWNTISIPQQHVANIAQIEQGTQEHSVGI